MANRDARRSNQGRTSPSTPRGTDRGSNDDPAPRRSDDEYRRSPVNRRSRQSSPLPDSIATKETNPISRRTLQELNESTLDLVNELKKRMRDTQNISTINERDIEKAVARYRLAKNSTNVNEDQWKKQLCRQLSADADDDLLSISRAYGDDPQQVATVLRTKIKTAPQKSSITQEKVSAVTLREETIRALTRYKSDSKKLSTSALFRAILEVDDVNIDRADRMFYSQASLLIEDNTYTYENAHDQVQAIRLMGHEIDDEEDFIRFIRKNRNFTDAYSFLQKLARDRVKQNDNRTANASKSSNRSITDRSQDDQRDLKNEKEVTLFNSNMQKNNSSMSSSRTDRGTFHGRTDEDKDGNKARNFTRQSEV